MVTFRDYMESALYAGGFYDHRTPTEDFYTAPELHGAFAGLLADEVVERLRALEQRGVPEPYHVVEMGSGPGTLGLGILRSIRERHAEWDGRFRYVFVERCESALLESMQAAGPSDHILGYSHLADLPPCSGVFLSNELVDAFPVHLLEKRGGRVYEVYVETAGPEGKGIRGGDGVRAELGPLSRPELEPIAKAIAPHLAEGGRHAVNLEAERWIAEAASRMLAGTLITVDYGKRFGHSAPNPPRAYYRHRTDGDVLARPGRQDLTASVDFDALIAAGERAGLKLCSYTTLSRFLLDRGILGWMPASTDPGDLGAYRERTKLKTLLHPEGMGEAFKVLIQEKAGAAA